jgi:hypothetical protein
VKEENVSNSVAQIDFLSHANKVFWECIIISSQFQRQVSEFKIVSTLLQMINNAREAYKSIIM